MGSRRKTQLEKLIDVIYKGMSHILRGPESTQNPPGMKHADPPWAVARPASTSSSPFPSLSNFTTLSLNPGTRLRVEIRGLAGIESCPSDSCLKGFRRETGRSLLGGRAGSTGFSILASHRTCAYLRCSRGALADVGARRCHFLSLAGRQRVSSPPLGRAPRAADAGNDWKPDFLV